MQVVINIDDNIYKRVLPYKDVPVISNLANDFPEIIHAIASGVPLPKGHGSLIDADQAISKICGSSCGCHLEECGHDKPCYSVTRIKSASSSVSNVSISKNISPGLKK